MKPKVEGIIYTIGGVIRMFDFLSDCYYFYSQSFHASWLESISFLSLIAPSIIFFFFTIYLTVQEITKTNYRMACFKFFLGLTISLLDPLGICLCCFGCLMIYNNSEKLEFFTIEALSRATGLVEGIVESIPQMLIQAYNNHVSDTWTVFTISSLTITALSFLYTCFKLVYALDQMGKFEEEHIEKERTIISAIQIANAMDDNKALAVQELEVQEIDSYLQGDFNNQYNHN